MSNATHASDFTSQDSNVPPAASAAPYVYPYTLDEELDMLFPQYRIGSSWYAPTSACHVAWYHESDLSHWLKTLSPERLEGATAVIDRFDADAITSVLQLDKQHITMFCVVLDAMLVRNRDWSGNNSQYYKLLRGADDKLLCDFLSLPVEMCAILLEQNAVSEFQVSFLRTSPRVVEWIMQLSPSLLGVLFEIFQEYWETSAQFVSQLSSLTSDRAVLDRPEQWTVWALCLGCVPSELAFRIAVMRFDTKKDCEEFLNLAHSAIIYPKDGDEFDDLFRLEDPMDEIQSWLRDRAWLQKHEAAARHIRHLFPRV